MIQCGSKSINYRRLQIPAKKFHNNNIVSSRNLHSHSDDPNYTVDRKSVTGIIYEAADQTSGSKPTVQLYTKEGCTLCDKAKDVLKALRDEHPHSLEAIDITDADKTEYFDKYKWDIPVLHINGLYWTKHRLTAEEAIESLEDARLGVFEVQRGEPNAAAMEKKMAERKANS